MASDLRKRKRTIDRRSLMKATSGLALLFSALLLLSAAVAYSANFDMLAAATFIPPWVWSVVGLLSATAGVFHFRLAGVFLWLGWIGFSVVFVEEIVSCTRSGLTTKNLEYYLKNREGYFVVVSMNCVGGVRAVRDLERFQPDIALLQERPGDLTALRETVNELWGPDAVLVAGADTAVVGRGDLVSSAMSNATQRYLAHATIRISTGRELSVYSIRLHPPEIDSNLLRSACWSSHRQDREMRRGQLQLATSEYQHLPGEQPILFGGDFNVRANDGALSPLRPRLRDFFDQAGFGVGNTATNDLPLYRIDQLWCSAGIEPVLVTAVKSKHSDHRIVVGVFRLK